MTVIFIFIPHVLPVLYTAEGTLLDGTVVSTTAYGAFVRLAEGVDGMVHISEISDQRLEAVTEVLNVGDQVRTPSVFRAMVLTSAALYWKTLAWAT